MDERQLAELFRVAAGQAPPASFDEQDVAAAARKVTQRRRSVLAGGGGLAVVLLVLGLVFGAGGFRHTLSGGGSAGEAAAPVHSGPTVTNGHTLGPALAGPEGVTPPSFPVTSPLQGGAGTGEAGHGAGSTHAGCGPTDGGLAVALASELPSVGAPVPVPAALVCPPGSRSASYAVSGGHVTAVLVPSATGGVVRDATQGSRSQLGASVSGHWTVVVVAEPARAGGVAPLADRLAALQRAVAGRY